MRFFPHCWRTAFLAPLLTLWLSGCSGPQEEALRPIPLQARVPAVSSASPEGAETAADVEEKKAVDETSLASRREETPPVTPGAPLRRQGDEIVAAGRFFHVGAPVVLWMDPGGYDAYRVEKRFAPLEKSGWSAIQRREEPGFSPNRYNLRNRGLSREQVEKLRGGGWDLEALQQVVDQFVIHFDAAGVSRQCFKVLHDRRYLSSHFLLDIDGTIYQTLDLKERAWHATSSNTRSIGIEIAHIGAYSPEKQGVLDRWYAPSPDGGVRVDLPDWLGDGGVRTPGFVGAPARPGLVRGEIQGKQLVQYDFTPEQYESLIKLTAALCRIFPRLRCDYPKNEEGELIVRKLPDSVLRDYRGLIGHFHIQANKVDPGPAFQWETVVQGARKYLRLAEPKQTAGLD